jgi:hypothetical protein
MMADLQKVASIPTFQALMKLLKMDATLNLAPTICKDNRPFHAAYLHPD